MTTETPLPDRCGSPVQDKVGLEVELASTDEEHQTVLTDQVFDVIRLENESGSITVDAVPNYEDVRQYLWDDYEPTHVGVVLEEGEVEPTTDELRAESPFVSSLHSSLPETDDTAGSPPSSELTWADVRATAENVTNRTTELQGYCERYPMDDSDYCYNHQEGPGAPEGNTNSLKHGLYAQRTNFYKSLSDEDKEFIEALVDSWLDQAPFERDNVAMVNELYRCAIDQLRAWSGIDEFVEGGSYEGIVKEQEIFDGEEVHEIEDEHPANLPYSRLSQDIQSKLKDLGIFESPEQQQAEATMSLAQKLSGANED